jgi:predicted HTH domain antitoxin
MALTLEVPDDIARALPLPEDERQRRLQVELACLLYAKNWLSYGQAVRLSGLDYYRFAGELGDRNIPRHYGEQELREDLAYARGEQHVAPVESGDHRPA